MTVTAPHPHPAPNPGATRAPGPAAFPPPAGPRLDAPPGGGPRTIAARSVDWWGWQARVRAAAGPTRASVRPRGSGVVRRTLAVGLGVAALVGLVAGGIAVVGPRAGSTRASAAVPAASRVTATDGAGVTALPLELVGVSDLPPPPAPAAPAAAAPVATPWPGRAHHPVRAITVDLVDGTRPAVDRGDGVAGAGRLIRTVIRIPEPVDDTVAGPFPVIVFAHGYATSTAAYGPLLDDLAAAGYVVAAPELPVTSTAYGTPVGAREPAEQVTDLRVVIAAIPLLAAGDGPLQGAVRDGPVAVIGHSDGGITAAAIAFSTAARDDRVGAAVVLSGARLADGAPWFPAGGPALLAVHGDADDVNPFAASQALYAADRSGSPRALVRVRDGGHTDAFLSARTRPDLVALVDDFIRATVGDDADAAARVPADASVPGVLELVGG